MNLYHKFLKKIAHFQVQRPFLTLLIILLLTIAVYDGVGKVKTVASLEQMMPKDVEEIKAFNVLRDNYLGEDMVAIVIEIDRNNPSVNGIKDIKDKRVYDYILYVKKALAQESDILKTYAYTDLIQNVESNKEYEQLLNNQNLKNELKSFINEDSTITIILGSTDISANDPRMNLLTENIKHNIATAGHPPGTKIHLTGTPVIQQKLGELIAKDRTDTRWISTFFVFLITMIIFGTFTSALVPITVVSISVTWLYATMGHTNLPISTLAGGVAAMVIGIGIDFAIHIMNKFKYERKKGNSVKDSIELSVVETGTALTATSITTIVAFLAFLFGTMPEMGRFGMLMAIGIAYSLIFSLFGLPALLIAEEKLIYYLKSKLRFGIEGELQLKADKNACEVEK